MAGGSALSVPRASHTVRGGASTRWTRSRSRELLETSSVFIPPLELPDPLKELAESGEEDTDSPISGVEEGGARGNSRHALSPVREDDDSPEADQAPGSDKPTEEDAGKSREPSSVRVDSSPGDQANISGTTYLATESELETKAFDISSIIDSLPALAAESKRILTQLAPANLSHAKLFKAWANPNFIAQLKHRKNKFESQKKYFGNTRFIDVDSTPRLFFRLNSMRWDPRPISAQANLAQLVLDAIYRTSNINDILLELDNVFPSPFIIPFLPERQSAGLEDKNGVLWETFKVGLEIRTQHCLTLMKKGATDEEDGFNSESTLEDVFNTISLREDDTRSLRGWDIDGLQDDYGCLPAEFRVDVLSRMESIRDALVGQLSSHAICTSLDLAFPESEFIITLVHWIRSRADVAEERLKSQLPLVDAVTVLQSELSRRSSLQPPSDGQVPSPAQRQNARPSDVSVKKAPASTIPDARSMGIGIRTRFSDLDSIKRLKEREERLQNGTSTRQPAHEIFPSVQYPRLADTGVQSSKPESSRSLLHHGGAELPTEYETRWVEANIPTSPIRQAATREAPETRIRKTLLPNGISSREIFHTSMREKSVASSRRPSETPTKRRAAFIDPQPGAQKLSPIRSFSLEEAASKLSPRKRTASARDKESQWEPDDEDGDGFQTDDRSIGGAAQRRKEVSKETNKRRRLEVRQPNAQLRSGTTEECASVRASSTAPIRERSESVSWRSALIVRRPPPRHPDYHHPDRSRELLQRRGTYRIPWTMEECDQLKALIIKHGPKWAVIKLADEDSKLPKLSLRSQVNIKDKARQMKVDYYKSRQPLPRNFEHIHIQSAEKDKLRRMGIKLYEDISDDED